jgi:type IV pilus assembly protein PilE
MNAAVDSPAASARWRGFSLLELLVTMAIVAILSAIAVPMYRNYVLQGNRTDAIRFMTFYRQALERCYSQNFSYLACPTAPGTATTSADGYYNITFPVLTATQYTIVATPTPVQANDLQCSSMQVSQNGAQSAQDNNNNDTTVTCWGGH